MLRPPLLPWLGSGLAPLVGGAPSRQLRGLPWVTGPLAAMDSGLCVHSPEMSTHDCSRSGGKAPTVRLGLCSEFRALCETQQDHSHSPLSQAEGNSTVETQNLDTRDSDRGWALKNKHQCFSTFPVLMNHLGILLKCRFRGSGSGAETGKGISNHLPDGPGAACPQATL